MPAAPIHFFCPGSSDQILGVISHFGFAAEDTPLRRFALCPSNLGSRFRFSWKNAMILRMFTESGGVEKWRK